MADAKERITQGLTAMAQSRFADALVAFEEVTRLEPENDQAWMGMAIAHERAGALDPAIDAIQRAIALQPTEPLHYTTLSRLFQKKGMKKEAEDAMARSFQLSGGK